MNNFELSFWEAINKFSPLHQPQGNKSAASAWTELRRLSRIYDYWLVLGKLFLFCGTIHCWSYFMISSEDVNNKNYLAILHQLMVKQPQWRFILVSPEVVALQYQKCCFQQPQCTVRRVINHMKWTRYSLRDNNETEDMLDRFRQCIRLSKATFHLWCSENEPGTSCYLFNNAFPLCCNLFI